MPKVLRKRDSCLVACSAVAGWPDATGVRVKEQLPSRLLLQQRGPCRALPVLSTRLLLWCSQAGSPAVLAITSQGRDLAINHECSCGAANLAPLQCLLLQVKTMICCQSWVLLWCGDTQALIPTWLSLFKAVICYQS
ncbi:hypothetical protein DUNSADRAFT_7485 [Dunaliella salina]|uniref:Uncharacterized protein n=1 Tax=Dunaliella salina TaxID=3046 RepID=A0ABQ7GLB7_DUNSA|nr:hypothetical protein DUNSADRAFT_7485 [Dunaliella salina]|eukprot:KAF5835400.1 hypothetical protein DUNSADRAFT_7485 [Dunaliella salina]